MQSPIFCCELFTEQPSLFLDAEGSRYGRAQQGWSVRNANSHSQAIDFIKSDNPFGSHQTFRDGIIGVLVKFECRRVLNCTDHCVVAHYDIIESEAAFDADRQKTQ